MIKRNSLAKVLIIFALNMAPVCKTIHAQSANTASSIIESPHILNKSISTTGKLQPVRQKLNEPGSYPHL
jgi:hypothetical protein